MSREALHAEIATLRKELFELKQRQFICVHLAKIMGMDGLTCVKLTNYLPDGLTICDLEGNINYASPKKAELYGYNSNAELIGKNVIELIAPEDREKALVSFQKTLEKDAENNFEGRLIRKDGSLFYGQINASLIKDDDQKPICIVALVRDVTEKIIAQQELQESEERFDRLSSATFEGIVITLDEGVVDANQRFAEMFGYSQGEILGKSPKYFVVPEHQDTVMNNFRTGYEKPYELNARKKDGSVFPVEIHGKNIRYKGRWARVTSIRDISARKKAEQALRASEELLSETGKIAKVGGWEYDVLQNKQMWTKETYRIHEMDPSIEPTSEEAISFYPPDIKPKLLEAIKKAIHKGVGWDMELPFITKTGRHRWVRSICKPHFENGKVVKLSGAFQDITERVHSENALKQANLHLSSTIEKLKENERALTDSEERFRLLVENARDAFFLVNSKGRIINVNKEACESLGYTREELLNLNIWDVCARAIPHKFEGNPEEVYEQGLITVEDSHIRKDGSRFPVEVRISYFRSGNEYFGLGLARDITERKLAEQELRKAKEKAEAASRAKSEFLANMSHEIRTPMNGILGYLELLFETDLNEEQREYLNTIDFSAEALLNLINDILDISKVEAGKLKVDKVSFDLGRVINETLFFFKERAREKQIDLNLKFKEENCKYVFGDPARTRQVLLNLIGNAMKFTDQGHITIGVEKTDGEKLRIAVEDTGIGIDREQLKYVFDKFHQVDSSNTRKYSGTGLGLTISKQLVELMDGEIGVESNPGSGSVFWFTLPIVKFTPESEKKKRQNRPEVIVVHEMENDSYDLIPVLVVEDNLVNQRIVSSLLKKLNCTVDIAENGVVALEKIESKDYALIFMDCQMQVMDGYEATAKIRQLNDDKRNVPVIALTANALKGAQEKCLAAGMDDYICKPVRKEALQRKLQQWVLCNESESNK